MGKTETAERITMNLLEKLVSIIKRAKSSQNRSRKPFFNKKYERIISRKAYNRLLNENDIKSEEKEIFDLFADAGGFVIKCFVPVNSSDIQVMLEHRAVSLRLVRHGVVRSLEVCYCPFNHTLYYRRIKDDNHSD